MSSLIHNVTIDSRDAFALADFWSEVVGHPVEREEDDSEECPMASIEGASLLFITVPEAKTVKNRLHFDLRPQDRTRDEEVVRVLALGATLVDDQRNADGTGWVVLADPEGNEFCVCRSTAER